MEGQSDYNQIKKYITYHNFFFKGDKIIKLLENWDRLIYFLCKILIMCIAIIINFKFTVFIFQDLYIIVQKAIEFTLPLKNFLDYIYFGLLVVIFLGILLSYLISISLLFSFFRIFFQKYYKNKITGFYESTWNQFFVLRSIGWYCKYFSYLLWLLFLSLLAKFDNFGNEGFGMSFPMFMAVIWFIMFGFSLKMEIKNFFNRIFAEYGMYSTIQVGYLDFQQGNIIDKDPKIKEGQVLKIQVEPYPRNETEANLISILNTKTKNKEAIVFQFYDEIIADKLRVDHNAIEVTVKKVRPYYDLDLKLKRNFLFDYETEPDFSW